MFDSGVLKRGVIESDCFCTGDLPMYTIFYTDPSLIEKEYFMRVLCTMTSFQETRRAQLHEGYIYLSIQEGLLRS